MTQELIKYIFLFLLGTSVLNFLIAVAVRLKTKHKEFNSLVLYWPAIILTFLASALLSASPTLIAYSYFFQMISSNLIVKMMCSAQGLKIQWRNYLAFQITTMLTCAYLLNYTNAGFTAAVLPVSLAFSIPFIRPVWHALVTNRKNASWIEKGMGYVFLTGIINHFNFALFRLDESTAFWGWSVSIAQYQCLSLFLPLLINHRREENERKMLELNLTRLTGRHEDKLSKIEDLYQKLDFEIARSEELNLCLTVSNKKLEEEREVNEVLIRTISHDLANPLTVIKSYLDLIHAKIIPPEDMEKSLNKIKNSTLSAIDMIMRIRKAIVTRTQAELITLEPVVLRETVKISLESFENSLREKNLSIEIDSSLHSDMQILADRSSLIEHIFANLLSNAIKFSYEGSKIQIFAEEQADTITLRIRDWGVGIQDDTSSTGHLQSSPGTMGEKGTGFGLMVLGYFVRKFEADFEISKAQDGAGTVASLTLKKPYLKNSLTSIEATESFTI